MFELEYERKQKGISANTQTTFIRLSVTYTVSGGLIYAISYLPEFYRPVMIPVILLTAVSNSMVAVSFGLFFDLVLALTVGGSFYALAAYMMLTMLAAVLAQALKENSGPVRILVTEPHQKMNVEKFAKDHGKKAVSEETADGFAVVIE